MRRWLLLVLPLLLTVGVIAQAKPKPENTLLFVHARLVDGTGNPWRWADVAVAGDRITFVGDAARAGVTAQRTIDLHGLYLTPGFIDLHTHTAHGFSRADEKDNLNYIMQGVTTVATGNDGSSPWPIAATLATWKKDGVGSNVGLFIGFGTVRQKVMGRADVQPTPAQLKQEKDLVAAAMRQGALGLSTGLFYVPQSFSKTPEVIALAKVAQQYGGFYDTHLRDESDYTVGLKAAVAEAIEISREANIQVMISHIKALGRPVWGEAPEIVRMIDDARAAGHPIVANQYAYKASLTSFEDATVPNWALAGGRAKFLARMKNPADRARLLKEIPHLIDIRGGAETLTLVHYQHDPSLEGKSLADMAKMWNITPAEAVLKICAGGPTGVISHNMQEADVDLFMQQDWVATASDGESTLLGGWTHPRSFGNEARKIHRYVVERHLITLPFAIRAATSLPAAIAGFHQRGLILPGYYADINVFDLAKVQSPATYAKPSQYAEGFVDVLVNGRFAVENGKPTHALAGDILYGPGLRAGTQAASNR